MASAIPSKTLQKQLRVTFTEDAELYDRSRPHYPAPLFADLAKLANLTPSSRILEVGSGTGRATLPLAALGCRVTGIELGSEMAALARRNLSAFPKAEIIVSTFEDWQLPKDKFDLVVSVAAWHWIEEDVRMVKAADALREEGVLAIVSVHHVKGGTVAFFDEVQLIYEKFEVVPGAGIRLPAVEDIQEDPGEFEREKQFGDVEFRRYEWEQTYSTEEYLNVLSTYSNHRLMEEGKRSRLLSAIAHLINGNFGGKIAKRYMVQMAFAKKL
jgi:SAM-dependent methyltransferase